MPPLDNKNETANTTKNTAQSAKNSVCIFDIYTQIALEQLRNRKQLANA